MRPNNIRGGGGGGGGVGVNFSLLARCIDKIIANS